MRQKKSITYNTQAKELVPAKTELPLSSRVYKCDKYNSEIDRDLNATINILNIREAGRELLVY